MPTSTPSSDCGQICSRFHVIPLSHVAATLARLYISRMLLGLAGSWSRMASAKRESIANPPGDRLGDSPTLRLLFYALHYMHADFEQSHPGGGLPLAQIRVLNGLYEKPGSAIEQLAERSESVARAIAAAPPGVPELVKRQVNWALRDQGRVTQQDRQLDVDSAHWDAAGVEPSDWMLNAHRARRAALAEIAERAGSGHSAGRKA